MNWNGEQFTDHKRNYSLPEFAPSERSEFLFLKLRFHYVFLKNANNFDLYDKPTAGSSGRAVGPRPIAC
jgi:hypothetical protein